MMLIYIVQLFGSRRQLSQITAWFWDH